MKMAVYFQMGLLSGWIAMGAHAEAPPPNPDLMEGEIRSDISPATDKSPRNVEGDFLVRQDGSLLAVWCNSYRSNGDLKIATRLCASESYTGGRTWEERYTLQETLGDDTIGAVSLMPLPNREVLLFFLVASGDVPHDVHVYVRRSFDEGKTFGSPMQITRDAGRHFLLQGRCVQLSRGRLLCPVSWRPRGAKSSESEHGLVYYSDDRGHTWERGRAEVLVPNPGRLESSLVELPDGKVLMLLHVPAGLSWRSASRDGGLTWSDPALEDLPSMEATPTLCQVSKDSGLVLLLWNASLETQKRHGDALGQLSAMISKDEGRSWGPGINHLRNDPQAISPPSVHISGRTVLLSYAVGDANRSSWQFQSVPLNLWLNPAPKP